MTPTSLSQTPNFKQSPLSKKGKNCYSKENSKLFRLKACSRNINYKDPLAWAVYIYGTLPKPIQRVFDYLRKLETCRRTKGYIFIEDETIGKRLGYKDKKTVQKYIKHLVKVGLLWRHRYYPPREAAKGSKRFMCTFLNIDQFRQKQIGKYRRVGVLHKKCIQSFEKYVQYMKDQSTNFMREEMEETQAEIDANEARNELNYQREKNDRKAYAELSNHVHHALYENAASITQFSLRDKYDTTIYNNSSNSFSFGQDGLVYLPPMSIAGSVWDAMDIANWLKTEPIHIPNEILQSDLVERSKERQLQILEMACKKQRLLRHKKQEVIRAFNALWTLKHDFQKKNIKKDMISYSIHAALNDYVEDLEKKVEKAQSQAVIPNDYTPLLDYLKWDDCRYPELHTLTGRMYSLCKELSLEVKNKFTEQLEYLKVEIDEWGITYLSNNSCAKLLYKHAHIYKELVYRSHNFGCPEIKQYLLEKIRPDYVADKPQ